MSMPTDMTVTALDTDVWIDGDVVQGANPKTFELLNNYYGKDNQNIYAEDIATSKIKPLTNDGSITMINGTFDWAYEEEFACRDGIRWSPDSKSIAYWQIDASSIKKFTMINNTISIYPEVIPIEYPKVGETPSVCKVGVVTIADAKTTWMNIPGVADQNYIVRMDFIPNTNNLLIQQLNRKQNNSKLLVADANTGNSKVINEESDKAWIEVFQLGNPYDIYYTNNYGGYTHERKGRCQRFKLNCCLNSIPSASLKMQ